MDKKKLTIVAIGIIAIVLIFSLLGQNAPVKIGSVGNEPYEATTTVPMADGFTVLKSTYGELGSIVIASSTAHTFKVWNATSTTDAASTTPVQFVASPTAGTYTFDSVFPRGIIVELGAGFDGSYTITYR